MITGEQVNQLIGAKVYDPAGEKIGSVGQVYIDERDGSPSWAAIRTGWFGTTESFVPLDRQARFSNGELYVSAMKDVVKDAPHVEPGTEGLSEQSAAELYRYYNMPFGERRGTERTGQPPTAQPTMTKDKGRNLNLTRYEEQLRVTKQQVEAGHVRLRKHVVTEDVTTTVPVSHEEVRVTREPIRSGQTDRAHKFTDVDEEASVTLYAEEPVVTKETIPVEKVGLTKETRTEQRPIRERVRKEEIDIDDDRSR